MLLTFQIQNPSRIGRFLSRELLSDLFNIFGMYQVVYARIVKLGLGMIQHGSYRIGNINDSPRITGDDKEKSIRCLKESIIN